MVKNVIEIKSGMEILVDVSVNVDYLKQIMFEILVHMLNLKYIFEVILI